MNNPCWRISEKMGCKKEFLVGYGRNSGKKKFEGGRRQRDGNDVIAKKNNNKKTTITFFFSYKNTHENKGRILAKEPRMVSWGDCICSGNQNRMDLGIKKRKEWSRWSFGSNNCVWKILEAEDFDWWVEAEDGGWKHNGSRSLKPSHAETGLLSSRSLLAALSDQSKEIATMISWEKGYSKGNARYASWTPFLKSKYQNELIHFKIIFFARMQIILLWHEASPGVLGDSSIGHELTDSG